MWLVQRDIWIVPVPDGLPRFASLVPVNCAAGYPMMTGSPETDDPITMASLYNTMGGIYWTRSRFSEAIECVQHSLNIYKNLQYHWGMANSLTNLGILHYSTEKWTQAVDYFEQADRLRSEYGADPERPINLNNLSEVLKDLGEFKRARSILETSREISRRLGLNLALIHAEFNLCLLAINEDLVDEARAHLKNAELLIESLDEPNERVAQYYQLQAQVELMENDLEAARRSAEQALSIARTGDIPEKQVDGYRILGTILIHQHNYEQADLALDSSIQMAQQLNDHFSEAKARYLSGVCSWEWGKKDGAEKFKHLEQAQHQLEAAARTFETLGARYDLKKVEEIRAQIVPAMDSDEFTQQETEIEAEMNLLRARLHLYEPRLEAELHRRAAGWYARHAYSTEAVQHALESGDYSYAADLIEEYSLRLIWMNRIVTTVDWFKSLPAEVMESHLLLLRRGWC